MKKILITIVATVLVCACVVGGTMAWLMDKTNSVTNTFTVGKVDIDLTETTAGQTDGKYKIVPGTEITKDPKVIVKSGSEACWVFIKIEEDENWPDKVTYINDIDTTKWIRLNDSNVWYLMQDATASDVEYPIFTDDTITVPGEITAAELGDAEVTLIFTAYAVQQNAQIADAAAAWAIAGAQP